jgi:hypothetical protein
MKMEGVGASLSNGIDRHKKLLEFQYNNYKYKKMLIITIYALKLTNVPRKVPI